MCGIAGILIPTGSDVNELKSIVTCMTSQITHRGPDDSGVWTDQNGTIGLGHRRLSIVDLTTEGHQPKISPNQRFVIVFNGEIYNYKEIRTDLLELGHKFSGSSDTEVMLAAFEEYGIELAVNKFIGMFAFAVWDQQGQTLYLGRDRIGEKPLYYGWLGDKFVFTSELKALKGNKDLNLVIDRDVIPLYLRHNYIPAPYSIYKGVLKLEPGTLLKLGQKQMQQRTYEQYKYWDYSSYLDKNEKLYNIDENVLIQELESLLHSSIKQQMIADVPIGAFLSGGIDSSTVVSIMQANSTRPIKTFSIGFNEKGFNEAIYAKEIAQYLGTDHTELYLTPKDCLDVIPLLPKLYDEPFADSSQIPTYLVSKLAKSKVTVSLSGDAGDELFGGYNRYLLANNIWGKVSKYPVALRKIASKLLTIPSPQSIDFMYGGVSNFLPKKTSINMLGDKVYKFADILAYENPHDIYQHLISHWKNPLDIVLNARELNTVITNRELYPQTENFIELMMYLDIMSYLPDDILVKVDRASMGVSLESRVPFLDHRIVEFSAKIPLQYKIREGKGKWVLRQILYKYVPKNLVERPKMGFGVPIDSWLRNDLKEWGESLLSKQRIEEEGFFNYEEIKKKWDEHQSGKRNWQYHLWDILMFQAWLDEQ